MTLERSILVSSWIISIILLKVFVPKKKKREAWLIFLFMQTFNWYFGLVVVEFELIKYPVVLFEAAEKANRTSFLFEFMAFPVLCVMFTLYLPKRKPWHRRVLHRIHRFDYPL
ncbi:CBO0543 family protein [Ammoniphilus sp. YIM 78166]|uniref:CBO0543 family protein n=1 Tax=Ammoniphilus sp. YIM 78166 TaxID=1644106 RepID=UPI00351495B1